MIFVCIIFLCSLIESAPVRPKKVSKGNVAKVKKITRPSLASGKHSLWKTSPQTINVDDQLDDFFKTPLSSSSDISDLFSNLESSPSESGELNSPSKNSSSREIKASLPFSKTDPLANPDFFEVISNSVDDIFLGLNQLDWEKISFLQPAIASVSDLSGISDASIDKISNNAEDSFDKKYQEFTDLVEKSLRGSSASQSEALKKALEFQENRRDLLIYHVISEGDWSLARRMFENGFDAPELINHLNEIPMQDALKIVDLIGYYGIFWENGFKMTTGVLQPADLLLRSISSNLTKSRILLGQDFIRLENSIALLDDTESQMNMLSKLNETQKSAALAFYVINQNWDIAKKLISMKYDQKLLFRVLDHMPDNLAINALKKLNLLGPQDFHIDA